MSIKSIISGVDNSKTDDYYKSPPGVQPDLFPESKPATNDGYAPAPDNSKTDFFPESEIGGSTVTLAPQPMEEPRGSGSCCPCCKEPAPIIADVGNQGGGCGQPVCGPPPIVGTPQNCCPQPWVYWRFSVL